MMRLLTFTMLLLMPSLVLAAGLPGAGKQDASKPIEIASDSLEVLQQEQKAIFTGNVVAVQGDLRMKSDSMTVFYTGNPTGEAKQPAPAKPAEGAAPQQSGIRRIEAQGHVFLSTPEETAAGEEGVYDAAERSVVLTHQVVLTRGQNILKGDRLVYNMDSGKTVVTSGGSGRVRALVVQEGGKK